MTARITVVGSLNMDLIARAARIPQPGETVLGGDFHTAPGGKGANQAVAAARLGAQVSMVGRIGDDSFGASLLENLDAASVDHTCVIQDADAATGVALIMVGQDGENSIIVASGANMCLSPSDVETAEAAIANADVLLMQLEVPLDTVIKAAQMARARGVTVVLNPAPAQELPTALLSLVDVLVPNESETALLTEMPVSGRSELEAAAMALSESGVDTVILTLGARGSLLAEPGGIELLPAFEVTPVDTTAAGDAFVGGFGVALAEGQSLREAGRWGNAAGALAATKLGAQPSLPTRQPLEHLLAEGKHEISRERSR